MFRESLGGKLWNGLGILFVIVFIIRCFILLFLGVLGLVSNAGRCGFMCYGDGLAGLLRVLFVLLDKGDKRWRG